MSTAKKTIYDVQNYLTDRLEKRLGIKFTFYVAISYVPALNKWFAHVKNMPNIQYEYPSLENIRDFDLSEKIIDQFINQIKEYFANVE